jgi:hypothetical protein
MGRKLIAQTLEFIADEQQAELTEAGATKKARKTKAEAPSNN